MDSTLTGQNVEKKYYKSDPTKPWSSDEIMKVAQNIATHGGYNERLEALKLLVYLQSLSRGEATSPTLVIQSPAVATVK